MNHLQKTVVIVLISAALMAIMHSCMKEAVSDITTVNRDIAWSKCFGGSDSDNLLSFIQTTDGNYIAAGIVKSTDGDITGSNGKWDGWLVKIKHEGSIEW